MTKFDFAIIVFLILAVIFGLSAMERHLDRIESAVGDGFKVETTPAIIP